MFFQPFHKASGKAEGKMYLDIESNEIVTEKQLYTEYLKMKENQPLEIWYPFSDYVKNCLTKNNGTLEKIN